MVFSENTFHDYVSPPIFSVFSFNLKIDFRQLVLSTEAQDWTCQPTGELFCDNNYLRPSSVADGA